MFRKIVFGTIALLVSFTFNAQNLFYSHKNELLFESLNNVCKIDSILTKNYLFKCTELVSYDTVNIIICKDDNSIVEHIGCKFLPDSINIESKLITQFVERVLLSVLLSDSVAETMKIYNDSGLFVLLNDSEISFDSLANKSWFFNLWKTNNGIIIDRADKNYMVTVVCPNNQNLRFIFKVDIDLISGMNKKEEEIQLAIQLSNYYADNDDDSTHISTPDYMEYFDTNDSISADSIFVVKKENFVIPQINGDLYYIKNDTLFTPVFDTNYVALSLSNAMLMPTATDYYLEIKHWMYGYKKLIYTMSSKDFFSFFSKDFDKYFGIETIDDDHLTGTLVFYNREAEYIHIAYISTTLDDLMNGGKIYVEFNTYIPQHNLRTLFGEEK